MSREMGLVEATGVSNVRSTNVVCGGTCVKRVFLMEELLTLRGVFQGGLEIEVGDQSM